MRHGAYAKKLHANKTLHDIDGSGSSFISSSVNYNVLREQLRVTFMTHLTSCCMFNCRCRRSAITTHTVGALASRSL